MTRLRGEQLFHVFLVLLFSYIFYEANLLPDARGSKHDVGTNFFPLVVSGLLLVLSVTVLIRSVTDKKADGGGLSLKAVPVFAGVLVTLGAYIFVLEIAGFIAATVGFCVVLNAILKFFSAQRLLTLKELGFSVVFFAAATTIIFSVFKYGFQLVMP